MYFPRLRHNKSAFTLVELLVSMTFLVILMLVVSEVVAIVQRTWVRSNSRVSQFREARVAFDALSRNVSQATLNAYWGNEFDVLTTDSAGQTVQKAKSYVRKSELQFVSGPANFLFTSLPNAKDYPGHGVFFQAPLGVTSLVAATGPTVVNTENMSGLLCGRGYFVAWGDDAPFRPTFLNQINTVPTRSRFRLLEYSPTAENNPIYRASLRPVTSNSKQWYQQTDDSSGALVSIVKNNESKGSRAFTRPIAENILLLIISPQVEVPPGTTSTTPYSIAPNYSYDSTLITQSGATPPTANSSQGSQHLLPPLLKISMLAIDQVSGEELSRNTQLRDSIVTQCNTLFKKASEFTKDLQGTQDQPGTLKQFLTSKKINFRVFTTTLALKQSRWSL